MTRQFGTRFVGRDEELRELLEDVSAAAAGRGRTILLGGEPGIGKSRLADELANRARDRGATTLWGRGWEDAGAPPYWPWVQALRSHVRNVDADQLRAQLGRGASDLAQLVPEIRDRLPDVPPPNEVASSVARFQMFDSTSTFIRNAATAAPPIVIVLDDLQAADTPSVLLLQFLATQISDAAVLIVGTYRDVELRPEDALTAAIAEIARQPETRSMVLTGLPPAVVTEYIATTVETVPGTRLAQAVWRATGGNPLFLDEAIRLLLTEGHMTDAFDDPSLRSVLPPGVRAVITRRISGLASQTIEMLELAATLGPEFGLDLLRRIGSYGADELLELVDDGERAGILVPGTGPGAEYRFGHAVIRRTLYDRLPTARRVRLHRHIAETIEAMTDQPNEAALASLAFHYAAAIRHANVVGDGKAAVAEMVSKAVTYSRAAAAAAARALAYEEAARLDRMALHLLERAGAPPDDMRAEILIDLGDALARSGDFDAARTTFLEAADIAKHGNDGARLARAALGLGGRHLWARPGREQRLIPLLQDALTILPPDEDRLRVRLLSRLACAWRSSPERREDSDALSRHAVELARDLDDATLLYAIVGRYWATWWPENPGDREPLVREAVGLAERLGDGEHIIDAHLLVFASLCEVGRLDDAWTELARLKRAIQEMRQPALLWHEPTSESLLALITGQFAAVEEILGRQASNRDPGAERHDDEITPRMHRFFLRREQGRVAEEEQSIRAAVEDAPWYPFHRSALACLLLELGRVAEGRAVFEDLAADDFRALYRDNEWLLGMGLASEACALLGDAGAAAGLYRQLGPFAGRHAIGHAEGSLGALDRYLGLLAATLGRLDDAVRHLEDAIAINERMSARPWAAHARHDLAVVLRRRNAPGDPGRADELDRDAWAVAREIGMALAERIDGISSRETRLITSDVTFASLRREGEYWTIEYAGDSLRMRDSRGLRHLARLLGSPGREIHALDLVRSPTSGAIPIETSPGVAHELQTADAGDVGPALDDKATAAYRDRLVSIREELAEAERWNDPERAHRLQAEKDALVHELGAAFGLGGRARKSASTSERARVSVTRALRSALARISDQNEALGAHLEATIRTGTFCSYMPDPRAPLDWRL